MDPRPRSRSLESSRRAAAQHAASVAAGPPRSSRWSLPAAVATAVGAAVAVAVLLPAAPVLLALTVLLLAVHRQDRRDAWRYAPPTPEPVRFLPPLREPELVIDLREPAAPAVAAVHVPTQAVPGPVIPRPRVETAEPNGGRLRARTMSAARPHRPPVR